MRAQTLHQYGNDLQYAPKDGDKMDERIFDHFVKELIREYGKYDRDGTCTLYVDQLPQKLQIVYLKQYSFYLGEIEHWEEIMGDNTLIEEYLKENVKFMDKRLAEKGEEVYHEFMEGRGLTTSIDRINGEVSYVANRY